MNDSWTTLISALPAARESTEVPPPEPQIECPDTTATVVRTTVTGEPVIRRLQRFLWGDDVFISYARADALDYALALADALTAAGISCFVDQWVSHPGAQIPPALVWRLQRSTMLVLVGSRCAMRSRSVQQEVASFLQTGRTLIPISVEGAIEAAEWAHALQGLALAEESEAALRNARPTDAVVRRVTSAGGFTRRNLRLARVFRFVLSAIVIAATLGAWLVTSQIRARKSAQDETDAAIALRKAAQREAASLKEANARVARDLARQEARLQAATREGDAARLAAEAARLRALEVREAAAFAPDASTVPPVLLALESARRTPGRLLPSAAAVLQWAARMMAVPDGEVRAGPDVTATAVDSEGRRVAAGYRSGDVAVWDARGVRVAWFHAGPGAITALAFGHRSAHIAVASGRRLQLVDLSQLQRGADTLLVGWTVHAIEFSPGDGYVLGAASTGDSAVAFSAATRQTPGFLGYRSTLAIGQPGEAVTHNGGAFVIASADSLFVLSENAGQLGQPKASALRYMPFGGFALSGNGVVATIENGSVVSFRRLDGSDAPTPAIVPIPGSHVGRLAFGSSPGVIAVSSNTNKRVQTVHLVSIYDAAEQARIVHTGPVRSLYFPPQGSRIVTVSADGTIRRWLIPWWRTPGGAFAHDRQVVRWPAERLVGEAAKRVRHVAGERPLARRVAVTQSRRSAPPSQRAQDRR